MGKGDKRRPRNISEKEENLRWELLSSYTTETRKATIRRVIKQLQEEKQRQK
jgi:hypothetical protein